MSQAANILTNIWKEIIVCHLSFNEQIILVKSISLQCI